MLASDNWDHKESSVDGKRTTHAMTHIFIKRQKSKHYQIYMSSKSTHFVIKFNMTLVIYLNDYLKPNIRPEPDFNPPVSNKEISSL